MPKAPQGIPKGIRTPSKGHLVGFLAVLGLLSALAFSIKTLGFAEPGQVSIIYPFDGSLFPPEIIAPVLWWEDQDSDANRWRVTLDFENAADPVSVVVDTTAWTPDGDLWESIKRNTLEGPATMTVQGLVGFAGLKKGLSSQTVSFSTSPDSVGAPIFYRDIPLPFIYAIEHISDIRWRIGNIGSSETPPVTLSGLPVCGNCHSFSSDGRTLGMDVDVANDKGAYVLTDFDQETVFSRDKIFSWHAYQEEREEVPTFGLLARVSPDGRYVVGGLRDRVVFLARSDLAFSQLFFPVQGSLAYYDRDTGQIHSLPGTDDDRYVQANGTWTPDGEHITFARSTAPTLTTTPREPGTSLTVPEASELLGGDQYIDESKEGYNKFLFDLFSVPFNQGGGGEPVPLQGASNNGKSNYFPKYSPDGKWLVFNQAESFMLLMPDSRLFIMPAQGGEARLMNCNTESMNSWHSWSPNGKWLVFSSKVFSPYTQLFLTHVDENGVDTPPVLLRNFVIPERAANIPEFVNIDPNSKRVVEERFIDDYNYLRRGMRLEEFGRFDDAEEQYLESLRMNPENKETRFALALSYANNGQTAEAEEEFNTILETDPHYTLALASLGGIYAQQGDFSRAIEVYGRALESSQDKPDFEANVHLSLGMCHFYREDYAEAMGEFQNSLELDPNNIDVYIALGNLYLRRGDIDRAIREFEMALGVDPSLDSLREKIQELRLLGGPPPA